MIAIYLKPIVKSKFSVEISMRLYSCSVYFRAVRGEISPQNSQIPPKILGHVINHAFNTNTLPSKFACCLSILVS